MENADKAILDDIAEYQRLIRSDSTISDAERALLRDIQSEFEFWDELKIGQRVGLDFVTSRYTPPERNLLESALAGTNQRLATGEELGVTGQMVKFRPEESIRYIQEVFFPDLPKSKIRVSMLEDIFGYPVNVDEIVPRMIGGRQVTQNQRILPERINKILGPIEDNALSALEDGTRVHSFLVNWK